MDTPPPFKATARREARVSPEIKSLLQKAATLEICVSTLQRPPTETVSTHEVRRSTLPKFRIIRPPRPSPPF